MSASLLPLKLLSLVALVTSAITTAGCGHSPTARADQGAGAVTTRVDVVRPERLTIRRATEQPGHVEAFETTTIHAKVSGYVRKWNVDIGTKVTRGQALAVLEVPELDAEAEQKQAMVEESEANLGQARAQEEVSQANLATARAKLEEVRASIKRADADLARWQAEFHRVEELFHQHAQTGSLLDETRSKMRSAESTRAEVDAQIQTAQAAVRQGQALLDKARSDVDAARASIKVARADAHHVQVMRDYTTIVAPYDGVVTRRNVNVGDLTETGRQGQPLFTVARDDVVRISLSVPELYATAVAPGNRAVIRLQALDGRTFEGQVTRTSWTLDAKNRTLRTEIDVPNPDGLLRPGLYAHVKVIVAEHPDCLTVPASAIVREDSQTFCVTVADGKARRKPVVLGLDDGTRVEIRSGLQGDEWVVKAYAASLAEGQAVSLIEPEPVKAKP
ncbi:MAG: efflux RND transporter periplasmic adaptor subunit [Isosphaeraceae bacterium]